MERSAAADSGPLIALAKVDRLALLPPVLGRILIGPRVEREVLARSSVDAQRIEAMLGAGLVRTPVDAVPADIAAVLRTLGAGEAEAIALAHARGIPLLIDERRGTTLARRLGVSVVGTAALLIVAKRTGHLDAVLPVLIAMRAHGYWLSDRLIEVAVRRAGESLA
jgi:predicted nucleic acid-binding protein